MRKVASTKPDETTIAKRGEQEEDETGDQDSIPKNRSPQTRHVEESSMDDNVDQATASNEVYLCIELRLQIGISFFVVVESAMRTAGQ